MHDTVYIQLAKSYNSWEWGTLLAAAGLLLGVILTSFAQIYIARKQISASVISTSRQHWVDETRKALTDLFTSLRHVFYHNRRASITPENRGRDAAKLAESNSLLKLYLNPKNNDHMRLHTTIREMIKFVGPPEVDLSHDDIDSQIKELGRTIHRAIQEAHVVFEEELKLIRKFK